MKIKLNFFIIPFITILIAVVGGYFTSQGVNGWYNNLQKPHWTPSGGFISAMWTFLYALVMIIVLIFWNRFKKVNNFKLIISLFLINGFLNATWSFSFFVLNHLFFSFIHIAILNLTIIALIILLWPKSKLLSLLLLPYAIWVTIAGVLNYSIYLLN